MRGGLRGFYVFIACIALGVMAIAGVGSVSASLSDGLAREGRTLLGGDVSFVLFQREAKPEEVAFLRSRGTVSVAATLRGMARSAEGKLALVEMKAVDDTYPMLGQLTLAPPLPLSDLLAERDGAFGAAADPTLLARLSLKTGDRVTIGSATFQIRSSVEAEPDKLAGGIGFGPRFLISEAGLRATGLIQPGSLVRWVYRVKLPDTANSDRATDAFIADARNAAPQAGWEVRSRSNASPQLERNISRFTQFLTLVGLAALLVGGVGVANAVKSHIDRRLEVIAALKAVGATGRDVFGIYLAQVVLLAAIGSVIGLALGAAMPFAIVGLFGKLLPLPVVPAVHADELALSFVYGLLTALAFGLWPLGRVHDVPVAALFRDTISSEWHRPRWSYLVFMAVVVALLVAVVIGLSFDKRIAAVFVRLLRRRVRGAARRRRRADGDRAPAAAHARHHAAARDRQHPPAGRADALGRALARARARRARHHHPDRRQSAPAVPGRAARARAGVLLHRHSEHAGRPLRRLSAPDRAGREGRATCRCCAGASSPPAASAPRTSSPRPIPNGCCRATAA